jgi:replicative DNA helicase
VSAPTRVATADSPAVLIPAPIGSHEAERGVLGGLLSLPADQAQAMTGTLTAGDFTDPRHEAIYQAVVELVASGVPADPITVSGHLRHTGVERCFTSDRAPGVFLFDLLDALPSLGNLTCYRQVVLEHSARRRARDAGIRITQASEQGDLDTCRQVATAELVAVLDAFDRFAVSS